MPHDDGVVYHKKQFFASVSSSDAAHSSSFTQSWQHALAPLPGASPYVLPEFDPVWPIP